MRLVFYLGFIFLTYNILYCQDIFQFHLGGEESDPGHFSYQTTDGNFLVAMSTYSYGFGDRDILISKLDPTGQILWSKVYGTSERDIIRSIVPADNGNMICISWTWTGQDDWTIFKIDQQGNLLNHITIGEGGDDELHFIEKIGTNQYILAGSSSSYHVSSPSDLYFASMDDNLNFNWFKSFGTTKKEYSRAVKYRSDSTLIAIATRFYSYETNADICLINMTMDGEIIWAYEFNHSGSEDVYQVLQTPDGGFITSGWSDSGLSGDMEININRFTSDGEIIWSKLFGGTGEDYGFDMIESGSGNYFITCSSTSFNEGDQDILLLEINLQGEILNAFLYGDMGNDGSGSLINTSDNKLLLSGTTYSYGLDNSDGIFIITDENGLSCCSRSPDSINVTDLMMTKTPVTFDVGNDYSFKNISFNSADVNPDIKFICHNNLHIVGPDSVCSYVQNINYKVSPPINISVEWLVPDNWVITTNLNDTSIYVNIDDNSGYIYLVNSFCSSDTIDSLFVSIYNVDPPQLGNDTIICSSDPFILNAGSNYNSYVWQDSSSFQFYEVIEPGQYWVTVFDEIGCNATDTITIGLYPETVIDAGNDTTVCFGESILLDAGFGFDSYLWQDGSSNQYFYAGQTGTYWVQVMDQNACTVYDTINLEFIFPNPNIGNDTAICSGDSIVLNAAEGYVSYLWQNGSDELSIVSNTEGLIWCEVFDTNGCAGGDSLYLDILFPPVASLGNDTVFCAGDSLWLVASPWNNSVDYIWQNGSTDSACLVWEEGEYWVMATNVCGSSSDSVFISVKALPWVYIGNDTILAMNTQIELDAGVGFEEYLWCDGCETQSITISEGGTYWVNVFDGLCYNSDTIYIEPIECELFIPIVFTPNGDGYNDYFYANASKDIIDFDLTVFNRWGEFVWETEDKDGKWDGQNGASKADEGTYFWVLRYKCSASPIQYEKKGSVTLLR